jgi:hypothetical protein
LHGGATVQAYLAELRQTIAAVSTTNDPAFGATAVRLTETIDSVERASAWLLDRLDKVPEAALAGAIPYLRLFASAAGSALLAKEALAATRLAGDAAAPARIALARFFAENIAVQASGLERTIIEGGDSVNGADIALAG